MDVRTPKLRIGWSWGTEDGWLLHRTIKDSLWKVLESDHIDIKTLIAILKVKDEWIEIRKGDKIPVNYPLFLFIWKNYKKVYRKLNPPLLYRLGINKVGVLILVLFKEDSAYTERFGGIAQQIIDHPEDWPKDDKETRLLALKDLKLWWMEEDWRSRRKDKIAKIFDWVIEHYDKEPFIQKSIDYVIDSLLANATKWDRAHGFFSPEKWYPRGKGPINYIVHGRMT